MISKEEFLIDEWLAPESRNSLKEAVNIQVQSEKKERLLRNPESKIDYGYSFPGLNIIKQSCLREIRQFRQSKGIRAQVLDFGAGFGAMTWKLLTAGACVDAFEIQKPSANELSKRMKNINPYFWEEDDLEDILNIYPENALNALSNVDFKEKYDFIWISQVLHFLTPDEIQKLSSIFKHTLKPGGRIFAETNCVYTFIGLDHHNFLQNAYSRAQSESSKYPGFITFNAATLIDESIDQVVDATIISAFNYKEMLKNGIPIVTNGYGNGYLGPNNDKKIIQLFSNTQDKYPTHKYRINRFHQVMNLLDEDSIRTCFDSKIFQGESYYFNPNTGEKITSNSQKLANCGLAFSLSKSPELTYKPVQPSPQKEKIFNDLSRFSLFNEQAHSKLLLDMEKATKNTSFLEVVREKKYSLALRKACAVCNLDLVKIILKYRHSLNIDINERSETNGYSAFDWVNKNQKEEFMIKERIISLLLKHGADSTSSTLQITNK